MEVVIETSIEEGMINLNHSLTELVRRGDIAQETAFRYSLNPKALDRLL
jgi:Tfp pilus assembly pilus retraction ATPase PilT